MEKANQKLRALCDFWGKQRDGDRLPRRNAFDPTALRPWIGNLALVEIVTAGEPLFRICGTNLHSRFGGEFTGREINLLPAQIAGDFRRGLQQACQTRMPLDLNYEWMVDGEAKFSRDIYLPLSDDNLRVSTVLFASFEVRKR